MVSEVEFRMYVPPAFAEDNPVALHRFIEQNSFGILISHEEDVPTASHLPFLVDWEFGSRGRLIGHLARANPQWKTVEGQEALVIFPGPHAYISPAWYQAEDVVPTWNYVTVHVYGRIKLIQDADSLFDMVGKFVRHYERPRAEPWSVDDRSGFLRKLCQQIVGFEIDITRIEGKWKLGQNHPVGRRRLAAQALRQHDDDNSQAIAAAMETTFANEVDQRE
jgi:transcriptional regulator